jgi:hypothetical protein
MRRKLRTNVRGWKKEIAEKEWTNLETILKTAAEETFGIVKKRNQDWIRSVNK